MSRQDIDTPPVIVAGLSLGLALIVRLFGITRSLGHDEVYTWVMFATRPLADILTSYHLPNNHILHTLLVRTSAALFGEAEWALRLPALLAGVLAVPVLFCVARRLTGHDGIASWSALLLAVSPVHVGFSVQARGYSLLVLLCLLHVWALLAAVEQWGAPPPPDREWLPWSLAALTGGLAVLTVPSAALLVGAAAISATVLIRLDLPPGKRLRAQANLLASTLAVVGLTIAVYLPQLDDVSAHVERFGTPLSPATWPGFVADVWVRIGAARWPAVLGVATVLGAGRLVAEHRAGGLFLAGLLLLPLAISLAVATGGQPRVYVFLLPFACVAVALFGWWLLERILILLPRRRGPRGTAAVVVAVALIFGFGGSVSRAARETGYRDTGRWIAEHTAPGDVVVVPYIVDSAIGYYSRGATVQRLREAVAGTVQRLLFVTRPGTPRFDLPDLMLATNFTTRAAGHADTYRHWQLPEDAFRRLERFHLTDVLAPKAGLRPVDLGDLLRPDSWRLHHQTRPEAAAWAPVEHPGHGRRTALRVRVDRGQTAVLHSVKTFTPAAAGLALLAYAKTGQGFASLYERDEAGTHPLQMALPVSPGAWVPAGDDTLFTELYLCPVRAGIDYGVYITAAAGEHTLADWSVYYLSLRADAEAEPRPE